MQLSTIIIDDEKAAIKVLTDYVQKMPFLKLDYSTTKPKEAIQFIQQHEVDLVFLDVQMPEISGLEVMKLIGSKSKFILTTGYEEYALQGYEYNIVDYLLKPISFERFLKAANKLITAPTPPLKDLAKNDFFYIPSGGIYVRIAFADILYISSESNYVNIFTAQNRYTSLMSLSEIEKQIPKDIFMRVHRSYIISIDKISTFDKTSIYISKPNAKPIEISLGHSYKTAFFAMINNKIISKKGNSIED